MHRGTVIQALIGAAILAASMSALALAKEGAVARMDTPIPPDAEPGSTIEVGWTAWVMEGDEESPIIGSPLVLTIMDAAGGEAVEEVGTERPSGSGHYVAKLVIPAGGVGEVTLGLRGRSCDAAGTCERKDLPIVFVESPVAAVAAVAAPVAPAGAAAARTTESSAGGMLPGVALLIGALGLVAAGLLVASRRQRPVSSGPTAG
jgi:hypothetical protein